MYYITCIDLFVSGKVLEFHIKNYCVEWWVRRNGNNTKKDCKKCELERAKNRSSKIICENKTISIEWPNKSFQPLWQDATNYIGNSSAACERWKNGFLFSPWLSSPFFTGYLKSFEYFERLFMQGWGRCVKVVKMGRCVNECQLPFVSIM